MSEFHIYKREGNASIPKFEINSKISDPAYYKPSQPLVDAVNVSINLGKPLFLTGNPGTGKTQLAHNLAYFFYPDTPANKRLLIFNTKSTSTAKDLFYTYDSLSHFQYTQNRENTLLSNVDIEEKFITYNALGIAINSPHRRVVLIDEIDKAPRDFPNDLLNSLEEMAFDVPEIDKVNENRIEAPIDLKPIVVITSNSEKNMPPAFLRRCTYFHISDPSEGELSEILTSKIDLDSSVVNQRILPHFNSIKGLISNKQPGTSELIYWSYVLTNMEFDIEGLPKTVDDIKEWVKKANIDQIEKLRSSYSALIKNGDDLQKVLKLIKN